MSRVTAIISALVIASSFACQRAVNYRITPLPTKPSATKNARELKLANAAITDMVMRVSVMLLRSGCHTKELADAKAENDALRDDVAAGRRRLQYQSSLSVSA